MEKGGKEVKDRWELLDLMQEESRMCRKDELKTQNRKSGGDRQHKRVSVSILECRKERWFNQHQLSPVNEGRVIVKHVEEM
jgi:hypothetical protein